jgi:Predicted integral membrane protein
MEFLKKMTRSKKNIIVSLILIAAISTISLILIPNMSDGHDIDFHLSRITTIKNCFDMGESCRRVYPNYYVGYGYASPMFYPDIFLYIPSFLRHLGISLIMSYKIFIFIISACSIFSMYISVKGITKNKESAIFSAILYGFSSYRLVDLFTRGALGESLSFIFLPIIIYGIYEIIYRDYKKFYLLVIGMSGLVLSHVVSLYIVVIFLTISCLVNVKRLFLDKKRIAYLLISALITLMITAFFIFPLLEQLLNDKFLLGQANPTSLYEGTVPIWALFLEFTYRHYFSDWIPPGIGIGAVILVYLYFRNRKYTDGFTKFCFGAGLICLIFSTKIFPWKLFQNTLEPIQFPWRIYMLTTVLLCIGGGLLVEKLPKSENKYIKIILCSFLIPVISIISANFTEYNVKGIKKITPAYGEYLTEKVVYDGDHDRGEVVTSDYPMDIMFVRKGINITIDFTNNKEKNNLELPLIYYKGYQAVLNGEKLNVFQTNKGLVGVELGVVESGKVQVGYGGTTMQKASDYVSLITAILFIGYVITIKVKKYKRSE